MRAPPRRQALVPLLLILLLVFCVFVLACLPQFFLQTAVVSVLVSYSEYLCLAATLLRCFVVVLIRYMAAILTQMRLCV